MSASGLRCVACGAVFPGTQRTCPKHDQYYDYLDPVYDYGAVGTFPGAGERMLRFSALLPQKETRITLGEGGTPLVGFGPGLFVKDESGNPSGSFKDREAMVLVNLALERGVRELVVASSGNAALALATYAKAAGLRITCMVPQRSSKLAHLRALGAEVQEVPGSYEDCYRALIDAAPGAWNVTPGANPFGGEGAKTIAYEIAESIGAPDWITVPCGNGANLHGIWKGFQELKRLGRVEAVPAMIGVQMAGAAPLKVALEQGKDFVTLPSCQDSFVDSIVATESFSSPKAVRAIRASGGMVLEVTDAEARAAMEELQAAGFAVEGAAGAALAGARKAGRRGVGVCILTGKVRT